MVVLSALPALILLIGAAALIVFVAAQEHVADDIRALAYTVPILGLLPAAYGTIKRQQTLEAQHKLESARDDRA